jgi:hypothetical protein
MNPMLATLLAMMSMSSPSTAPDIEMPDTKDATMKLYERERAQRAKFPSPKKRLRMKARKK